MVDKLIFTLLPPAVTEHLSANIFAHRCGSIKLQQHVCLQQVLGYKIRHLSRSFQYIAAIWTVQQHLKLISLCHFKQQIIPQVINLHELLHSITRKLLNAQLSCIPLQFLNYRLRQPRDLKLQHMLDQIITIGILDQYQQVGQ